MDHPHAGSECTEQFFNLRGTNGARNTRAVGRDERGRCAPLLFPQPGDPPGRQHRRHFAAVLHTVGWEAAQQEGVFMARERHVRALQQVRIHLEHAGECLNSDARPLELLAEALRQAQLALDQITGTFTADDLLGEIFAGFCIGK